MRSIVYVAALLAAIVIGMYQGPREAGVPTARHGGYLLDCKISGIEPGAPCPALPNETCTPTYNPAKMSKTWNQMAKTSTVACTAKGCAGGNSIDRTTYECNPVP